MKGITLCADCAYYSMKKHKCTRGATDEGKPTARFYADCPLDDVVPVKQGRWEMHGDDDDLSCCYFCSQCGYNMDESEYLDNFSHLKYCPHCGAKMDGETEGT